MGNSLQAIAQRWWLLVAGVVLGALAGGVMHTSAAKNYTATSTSYLAVANVTSANDLSAGSSYVLYQMKSFGTIATSPLVLDPVAKKDGFAGSGTDLAPHVAVGTSTTATTMTISVTDADSAKAAQLANDIAGQFGVAIAELTKQQTNGKISVSSTLVQPATASAAAPTSSMKTAVVLGGLAGLAVGLLVALVWGQLPARRSPREDAALVSPARSA